MCANILISIILTWGWPSLSKCTHFSSFEHTLSSHPNTWEQRVKSNTLSCKCEVSQNLAVGADRGKAKESSSSQPLLLLPFQWVMLYLSFQENKKSQTLFRERNKALLTSLAFSLHPLQPPWELQICHLNFHHRSVNLSVHARQKKMAPIAQCWVLMFVSAKAVYYLLQEVFLSKEFVAVWCFNFPAGIPSLWF